ncbi:hypothetical protein Sango_2473700 [Sesamum angolense]|uniref:Retrovirus-related Pol polyprotein from transposon TNT 1-94-like beta-barrel domain-containing protein n=1 Tax=Sesamum angolense TaxID=2727404 RepID=A0AAE2BHZ7_9LAMI|nr:hypothetical protein Sango_2473700 [Sesamum angolense]
MDDEDWEELQQRGPTTILLCLADEIMYHVMNLKFPGEVWKKLEIEFMSKFIKGVRTEDRVYAHNQQKQNAGESSQGHSVYLKGAGTYEERLSKVEKRQTDEKRDDSSKSANVAQNDNSNYSDGDMLSVSTNQYVDAWILDSGCSYHIKPNKEWFTSYRSGNFGSINLGNDRCCNIAGIGEVRIKMYDRTVEHYLMLGHLNERG